MPPADLDAPMTVPDLTAPELDYALAEWKRQAATMSGQYQKAVAGARFIRFIYEHGLLTGAEALTYIQELDRSVMLTGFFAQVWQTFLEDSVNALIGDLKASMRIGAKAVAFEMARPLYLLPPRKRWLLTRVLLGDDTHPRFPG